MISMKFHNVYGNWKLVPLRIKLKFQFVNVQFWCVKFMSVDLAYTWKSYCFGTTQSVIHWSNCFLSITNWNMDFSGSKSRSHWFESFVSNSWNKSNSAKAIFSCPRLEWLGCGKSIEKATSAFATMRQKKFEPILVMFSLLSLVGCYVGFQGVVLKCIKCVFQWQFTVIGKEESLVLIPFSFFW